MNDHAPLSGRDLIAALCVVLIWGTNFVAMKFGLRDFTPFQLGAGRFLFAILPLIFFIRPPKLSWRIVLLYGLCQGVGQFGLLFLSLRAGMSAALASVILQTQVFFTAIFSYAVLGERPSRALLAGLALAACGLACFGMNYVGGAGAAAGTGAAGAPASAAGATTLAGFLLCLCAAAMWAVSNIVVRRAQRSTPQFDVLAFMVWSSLAPILPFIGLALLFDDPATRWRWTGAPLSTWASLAYLGWMATILGYAMWTGLLKRHPVNRVAPFSLGVPVVGIAAGMLVLGDTINGLQWSGIALIVAALACVLWGGRLLDRA
ncbi:EamA family transporter [Pseudoduganella sp. UC29_71]|uniref:EamA family transporter n=1 Tax=Pseudoduganella sp. UC29_71 TaxID=3350174 RepID=UPI00366ABB73